MSDKNKQQTGNESEKNRTSRRTVLKAISAGSIFAGGNGVVSAAAADLEKVEVVLAEYKGEAQEVVEVPQEWRDNHLDCQSAFEKLEESFAHKKWVKVISRRNTDEEIEGMRKLDITIEVTDVATAESQIPDQIDGIDISIEEWTRPGPDDCDYSVFCVTGGTSLVTEKDDGSSSCCTSTCPIEVNGEEKLMSAAHCFTEYSTFEDEFCDVYLSGFIVEQGACDLASDFGHVDDVDLTRDIVSLEESSTSNHDGMDNTIEGETDRDITGHITESGVDILMSNDTIVYQRGRTTCTTSGEITSHDSADRCGDNFDRIVYSSNTTGGDSGGPHYHAPGGTGSDSLYILGPHRGGDSMGAAAHDINDELGWEFGINPTCSR